VSCPAAAVGTVAPGSTAELSACPAVSRSPAAAHFKVLAKLTPTNALHPCVAAAEKQVTPFQRVTCLVRLSKK